MIINLCLLYVYMENTPIINPENDLVFYEKNNQLFGGGYKLESELLTKSIKDKNSKGELSGGFLVNGIKDLAVPVGLLYMQNKAKQNFYNYDHTDKEIDNDIFDKLLNMMEPEEKKKHSIKTRKNKLIKHKTKKNK